MSDDLDVQIEQKEAELSPYLVCMEELKSDFINETVSFTAEWYRKTVKEYVTKYPQVLLSLKETQAARMKNQVNELIKDTEKTVKTELNNPGLWWHQKPRLHESTKLYLQIGEKPPEILDRAVRHVLGRLGVILEEYKFNVSASGEASSYKEFWFDRPLGRGEAATPSYPHMLKWTKEMQQKIQAYNTKYLEATEVYAELYVLKEEKKKRQATDFWESI